MKKITLSLIGLFVVLLLFINCNHSDNSEIKGGIEFQHLTFEKAIAKAQLENKIVFIDAYATWCGPCKELSKKTFTDKKVAQVFNASFVNVKIDVDESEGKRFAEKYEISSIPTLLFFDGKGNLLKQVKGFHTSDELLKEAKPFLK